MPLRDHFHEPLARWRIWTAFHSAWATYLAEYLNERLPEGYFAEPNVKFGIEIDVATWEEPGGPPRSGAAAAEPWIPSPPLMTVPFVPATDLVEVRVVRNEGGSVLAGAIELVSPANKDRAATRDSLVSKCATYLRQSAGLILIDIVTERRANLHRELLARLAPESPTRADLDLYAAAYRPVSRNEQPVLDVWLEALAIGQPLPTLPFWLRGGICLALNLEASYSHACEKLRLPLNGG